MPFLGFFINIDYLRTETKGYSVQHKTRGRFGNLAPTEKFSNQMRPLAGASGVRQALMQPK